MIFALQMSFTNYRPTVKSGSFVGLRNYLMILSDGRFWRAIYRSIIFTVGCLIPQIVLGLMMAQLLNHPMLKWKMLFRGLAITPWLIPTVAVAMIFRFMFNDIYGIINYLLMGLHIIDRPYAWMAHEHSAMFILIVANVWRGTPLMITMFLAALQGISGDLYEAAHVDGANAWTQFIRITIPLLMPVIMVSGILRFIWTFNFYDLPWVMTGGGPGEATQTAPLYAYVRAFSGYRWGEGSSITILLFFVLVFFAVIYFFAKRQQDKMYK
jgi:ABC-type sugar transport system permease subunit